jgi:hypothetical protein
MKGCARVCYKPKINSFTPLVNATLVYISVVDVKSMVIPIKDDLPSERGSPIIPSNSSSPLTFQKIDIDMPELDDTMETIDSLVSHPELATGIESEVEDCQGISNLPIMTDKWKLYKVTHAGATHFLRAAKAQFSPDCSPEKSLDISLVRNHLITNVVTCLMQIFYRWNVKAADSKCQT